MKAINKAVDWFVHIFGGIQFLVSFNLISVTWVILGLTDPHFFDPFPSNFYTLTVSWLAINMSILILWAERRSAAREERIKKLDEERSEQMYAHTQAILNLSEGTQQIMNVLVGRVETNDHDLDEVLAMILEELQARRKEFIE